MSRDWAAHIAHIAWPGKWSPGPKSPSACAQGPQGLEPAPRGLHEARLKHRITFNPVALLATTAAPAVSRGWRAPRGVAEGLGLKMGAWGVSVTSLLCGQGQRHLCGHSSTSWSPKWSQEPFAPSHVCGVLGPSLPHNEHSTTTGSCASPRQAGKMC